jgi:uncharacterized protein YbjT (DUF2867 family)
MYVLLGANGNITSKVARTLLAQGAQVRVTGRSAQRLAPLAQAGAQVAAGDPADTAFLTEVMRNAQAVYAMTPPQYGALAPALEYARVGEAVARAIAAAGVKRVVNLSSIGAHLPEGTGPIAGLHQQEQRLNQLSGVQLLHLRPGYFFENHLHAIPLIQALGVYTDTLAPDLPIPTIATSDIAAVVVRELTQSGSGVGARVLHVRGPDNHSMAQAAALLGKAIGQPDLPYVQADPAQAKAGLIQAGFSAAMADLMLAMNRAMTTPAFSAQMQAGPTEVTSMSLAQFAATFKAAYTRAA